MAEAPTVTVVIPVRNEEGSIGQCIERVLANDYPRLIEVLVVDGNSHDETPLVTERASLSDRRIKMLSNKAGLPYTAMNIGVRAAKGDVIVRVDARATLPPNYISECVGTLASTGADNVGAVQWQYGETLIGRAVAFATRDWFGNGGAAFRLGRVSGFTDTVYLGCFRRTLVAKIGEFDASGPVVSEDADFNKRIREAGGHVYLRHDLRVLYPSKSSLAALVRQYFTYGGAKGHLVVTGRPLTAPRQFVAVALCASVVILLSLSVLDVRYSLGLLALIIGYLLVDVLRSASVAIREQDLAMFPVLIVVFPAMHFAWATGFVVRLLERDRPGAHWRR
jgi:glycosyltransferase involved in cell wall biosynthesis